MLMMLMEEAADQEMSDASLACTFSPNWTFMLVLASW
jgi:hypothetical protein